jgi:hypothetical protein
MSYEREERIAIRQDSGMTEAEAIRLSNSEHPTIGNSRIVEKPVPECIFRLNQIQRRVNVPKPARKYEYT